MTLHPSPDLIEVGRAVGYDWRQYIAAPRPDWPVSVREGFAAAEAARVAHRSADRYVRKWLQLRTGAFQRCRVVASDVTPTLLREIDVERCPVTRIELTHGECIDSDWSVDRINNDGAYAANNLAVMSVAANRAKGSKTLEDVLALSRASVPSSGLSKVELLRLAAIMLGPCCVARPEGAPLLPLAAPIPNLSVRPGSQQIQHVFTVGARSPAGKNAVLKALKPACRSDRSLGRLRLFANNVQSALRRVEMRHDAWLEPGVMDAFVAWRESQTDAERVATGQIAAGLIGSTQLSTSRIASWHLDNRGYLC